MRLTSLALLLAVSCAPKPAPAPAPVEPAPAPAPPPPLPEYAQAMLDAMDPSVGACEDFYQYACGNWVKNTQIPADKPVWARSFSVIRERNLATNKEILEGFAKDPGNDPVATRLGTFYGACMDEGAANAAGLEPIRPLLAQIDKVKDAKTFMATSGELGRIGVVSLAGAWLDGDYKDPATSILYVSQSGLSLPDRDYYLGQDDASKALVAELQKLVAAHLVRAGLTQADADKQAAAVVAFEKQLAEASMPRHELRDPQKTYNKIDRKGLKANSPGLNWDGWLDGMGAKGATAISVETPDVFKKFEAIVKKTKPETLRAYLKFQTVKATAAWLDDATYMANFDVFGRKVTGQKEPEVRWKRCVRATDLALGDDLGKAYVDRRFAGESKTIALSMIQGIESSFEAGLPGLAWMDDPTRGRAVEKMKQITNKIGYPDKLKDYSSILLHKGSHALNMIGAMQFENARQMEKIGKPADRGEWYMSAPTINAYYNATLNEMVFPAGILQPPFFSQDFPAALNYGAIGMVMGHELSHGFDDQGRKFDGTGKMVEWWAPEIAANYEKRAACVKDQYELYEPQPGLKVNGALTLGENIADLGGLSTSYRAFKQQEGKGKAASVPGLTEDQAFFVAFAQGWCTVASPEYEKMIVLSDSHSPGRYRVNGPASNSKEFAKAFGCQAGSKMVRENACEVW